MVAEPVLDAASFCWEDPFSWEGWEPYWAPLGLRVLMRLSGVRRDESLPAAEASTLAGRGTVMGLPEVLLGRPMSGPDANGGPFCLGPEPPPCEKPCMQWQTSIVAELQNFTLHKVEIQMDCHLHRFVFKKLADIRYVG